MKWIVICVLLPTEIQLENIQKRRNLRFTCAWLSRACRFPSDMFKKHCASNESTRVGFPMAPGSPSYAPCFCPFTLYRTAVAVPQYSYPVGVLFASQQSYHKSYPLQDAPQIKVKSLPFANNVKIIPAWLWNDVNRAIRELRRSLLDSFKGVQMRLLREVFYLILAWVQRSITCIVTYFGSVHQRKYMIDIYVE